MLVPAVVLPAVFSIYFDLFDGLIQTDRLCVFRPLCSPARASRKKSKPRPIPLRG